MSAAVWIVRIVPYKINYYIGTRLEGHGPQVLLVNGGLRVLQKSVNCR